MPRDKGDDDLREKLWSLPHDVRCAMLVCSIVERDPRAFSTSCNLLELLMRMSQGLGQENRSKVSAHMRDAADHLEGCTRPIGDVRQVVH